MKVYLGEYNLLTEKEPLPMQKRIVTKVECHDFTHFIILFDNPSELSSLKYLINEHTRLPTFNFFPPCSPLLTIF